MDQEPSDVDHLRRKAFSREGTPEDLARLAAWEATFPPESRPADLPRDESGPAPDVVPTVLVDAPPPALRRVRPRLRWALAAAALTTATAVGFGIGFAAAAPPPSSLDIFSVLRPSEAARLLATGMGEDGGIVITRARILLEDDAVVVYGAVGAQQVDPGSVGTQIVCLFATTADSGAGSCVEAEDFESDGLSVYLASARYEWGPTGDLRVSGRTGTS